MTLYLKINGAAVPWLGAALNNITYPRNIEQLWLDTELAEIGLYHAAPPDEVPEGKRVVSSTIEIVNDIIKTVNILEDIPPPAAPNDRDVDFERERRIALPFSVTTSVGTFDIDMDPDAQRNIGGLATAGLMFKVAELTTITAFRDHDNEMHDLTPDDLLALGSQVMTQISIIYAKSWEIKSINPIPFDYKEDLYWK